MFFGWVEGYLVVVAPLVDELLAVFELLVDVVVGRVAWKCLWAVRSSAKRDSLKWCC